MKDTTIRILYIPIYLIGIGIILLPDFPLQDYTGGCLVGIAIGLNLSRKLFTK